MSEIRIFESATGRIQVILDEETVWLSLNQLSELFERDKSVISRHLRRIFAEEELNRDSVVAKNATTASDGKTYQVEFFNLDAIISVGYRVNSRRAVLFRQWATSTLKEHLTQGYTINQQRFQELEAALKLVRKAAASPQLQADTGRGLVEIISRYTQTFLWLQRYDEGKLNEPHGQHGGTLPTAQQASNDLATLKQQLMAKGEATDLFARPRGDGLGALLGNLDQTAFGEPAPDH